MSNVIIAALIFAGLAIALVAFYKPSAALEIGGIYSTDIGEGQFGVVKLLAYEQGVCHVRVYKQKFSIRPAQIEDTSLSLGTPYDPDGFGIGHMPLEEAGFLSWGPLLITKTTVMPEELEGYKIWKENNGGVFSHPPK